MATGAAGDEGSEQRPPLRPANHLAARALRRVRTVLRLWRLYFLRFELKFAPTEAQRLFALTIGIGGLCGLAAVAFHLSIEMIETNLVERAMDAPGRSWILWTILAPTLGGLLCGILLQRYAPAARGSGIPEVKATFALRERTLRMRDAVAKFFIGALQIGSGASLGREGPTVQICAAIASALGRLAGVSPKSLRRLLPVGAAAGVAAAFNAPIAAVTFTIEEIVGDLDRSVLSGVIVAAALAAVIERSVLGEHPVFDVPGHFGLDHVSSLLTYALLGVAAAFVSILFTDAILGLRRRFRLQRFVPSSLRPAVGGLVTGALAVAALLWVGSRGVTGGGYATLSRALGGELGVKAMVVLGAMKLIATSFCYGSGGAGGIFAPSLFVGGMVGGAIGALDVKLFGHGDATGAFALVGMGAVFAGVVRAPMTSVLIIIEMTGGYSLILPLMIANMTAYGLAHRLRPVAIYDALLEQDGIRLHGAAAMETLESIPLERVLQRDAPLVLFDPAMSAAELLKRRTAQEVYPVVDAKRRPVGLITNDELKLLDAGRSLHRLVIASDVMRGPAVARARDDLRTALETMLAHGIPRLPVVDDDGRIAGLVDEAMIARAYLHTHTRSLH
jgi:CIC family chloride channel protein